MDHSLEKHSSTRAIRRLTTAVWALALALLFDVGVTLFTSFRPTMLAHRTTDRPPDGMPNFEHRIVDQFAGFHGWSLEKKIESASVIAMTTYQEENGKLISVISEILKQEHGVTFYYQVGDEYRHGSRNLERNTLYGEGEIIFFTGSPPIIRYSATYSDGRCQAFGDIPLQTFKEMVAEGQ